MKLAERRDRRNPDAIAVKEIEPPEKGNRIVYDSEIKGFGVRVTAAGSRSFILNYVIAGRERRFTIGNYPSWGVEQARIRAAELRREIDNGIDPLSIREEARAAPQMADLVEKYRVTHLQKKREKSRISDEGNLINWVLPALGGMKVADVTFSDIDALHRKISKKAPIQANRVVALLSKIFSLAIRWEMRADNPCKGVEKNPETKRKRYLSQVELARLIEVLNESGEAQSANAIRLLLLTGARRGEVLGATWHQFDLQAGTWTKPSAATKQKAEHRVPLSAPAVELLRAMQADCLKVEADKRSPFLFPGAEGKPQQDIKKFWAGVIRKAEIQDVHIHDLRHTYASILVSAGLSLPIIGALLGHTQVQTTSRYAHLLDDPLRAATEQAASLILKK